MPDLLPGKSTVPTITPIGTPRAPVLASTRRTPAPYDFNAPGAIIKTRKDSNPASGFAFAYGGRFYPHYRAAIAAKAAAEGQASADSYDADYGVILNDPGYGAGGKTADDPKSGLPPGTPPPRVDLSGQPVQQAPAAAGAGAPNPYGVNPGNFDVPGFAEREKRATDYLADVKARPVLRSEDIQMSPVERSARTELGPLERVAPSQLGPIERMTPAQIGAIERAGGASATAGQAGMVTLDPAAQAADSAVRGDLMNALNYQGGLMRGENSVAAIQMARDRDRAIAMQRGAAASARPGLEGLAARNMAAGIGRIGGDFASRQAEAQLGERNAAATQYGNLGGTIRGQDNQLSMYNTGALNERNIAQGGISKDIGIANAGYTTQASIASAGNKTQAGIANAGNSANKAIAQGGFDQEASRTNADAGNLRDYRQGVFNQDAGTANANNANQQNWNQGTMDQNNNQWNAGAGNDWNKIDAANKQQNQQFNTSAGIDQLRNNDATSVALINSSNQVAGMQQDGTQKYEGVLAQYGLQARDSEIRILLAKMGIDFQKSLQPSTWERIMGAIMPLLVVGATALGGPAAGAGVAAVGGLAGAAATAQQQNPKNTGLNFVAGAVGSPA